MKLTELIKTNNWLSVELTLISLYPKEEKQIDLYRGVFEKLQQTVATGSDIEIVFTVNDDDETSEIIYVDVSGKRKIKTITETEFLKV